MPGLTTKACRGALLLRDWALELLATDPSRPVAPAPPLVEDAAWRIFLARERCASMLPSGPAAVGARAVEEARRSLAARAQLARIGELLAAAGIEAVVLKGGVTAALGGTLDLADVDLLVSPDRAHDVAVLLERAEGLERVGEDARVGGRGMTHLAPRVASGSIPVEVHFALHHFPDVEAARSQAVPLAGLPSLRRLAPPDHLRHLVVHSALQHRERCGRLRDLVLICDAVRGCAPAELAGVRAALGERPAVAPARAVLAMAVELADGRPVQDCFRSTAAAGYLLAARGPGRSAAFDRRLTGASVALAEGRGDYLRLLRSAADPWELASSVGWLATLERRWPAFGRALRITGATARTLLATPPAVVIAWRARRLAAGDPRPSPDSP
jgi:hypothetical protein